MTLAPITEQEMYLELVPNVRSHAVADCKVELNFGIGLTRRGVHQIATELT